MPRRIADPRVRRQIALNVARLISSRKVQDAAKRLGMSATQLSGYINGHRGFSIETLLRFAVGLRCSLDELVSGVDGEYARAVLKRRGGDVAAELENDKQLMDVLAGFEVMRKMNPDEAATVSEMFRARLVQSGKVLLEPDETSAARSTSAPLKATGTAPRPRRGRARR